MSKTLQSYYIDSGQIIDISGHTDILSGMQGSADSRLQYTQTRYVSFESVNRNRVHSHSYFEPCIVISGSGEFEHGPKVFALQRGDLFVADRGVEHEIRSVSSRDLKLFFLGFHVLRVRSGEREGNDAILDQGSVAEFLVNHRQHLSGQSHLIPLFEHVAKLVRRDPEFQANRDYHDASLLLLRQLLSALAESADLSDEAYHDIRQRRKMEEYIEDHLHLPIRAEDIAAACAVSERTLRRRWSSWSPRSLPDEVNHRRIERATHLLLLHDIAISDVGYHVGISSSAQFSRQFKAAKACTPSDYRRRYLDESSQGPSDFSTQATVFRESEED